MGRVGPRVEALGYSTMFVPDHFDEGYGPIAAMTAAALAAPNLTVATGVFAADFRHPAVVAREPATIDRFSEGRLEVGLGAGYQVSDYRSAGIAMDEPRVRVGRLIEAVAVLRGLFAEGPFDFDGEHFQIAGLDGSPAPFTPGGPPIMIAGGGKRMLRFAARQADIVGVNRSLASSDELGKPSQDLLPHRIDEKFAWIRDAAGPRYDDLVFQCLLKVAQITDDTRAVAAPIAEQGGFDVDDVLASPFILAGSVEEILDRLDQRRERWGFTYYTVEQPEARALAPVLAKLNG